MEIAIVGLGRMGAGIARRLMRDGHMCVGYDRNADAVKALAADGAKPASSLEDVVKQLAAPRTVWVMLPAGAPTEETVSALGQLLSAGDVVIDGGNSFYKDDIRRAKTLAAKGVIYMDVGVSGGVWGLDRGFCTMVGGDKAAFERLDPIFKTMAPGLGVIERTQRSPDADPRAELGYTYVGPAGAGHFVKMVHNGIEYGMMQAFAEGFGILKAKNSEKLPDDERYDLDLANISEVWRRGSVVSSWLLDLTAQALASDGALEHFTGNVDDSGEGRWTVEAAIEEGAPATVLAAALFARFGSRGNAVFGDKLLSAMRLGFGGHVEKRY
jgi:6-phosphogluconate dehydrogenase